MTAISSTAEDDLAYLRALAGGTGRPPARFGKAMLSGGLIHGALVLIYLLHFSGVLTLPLSPALHIVLPIAPSLIWLAYLVRLRTGAAEAPPTGAQRAVNAAFQSVGLVSLAVLPVSALIAYRFGVVELVFIHTVAVLSVLGAAWYVAFRLLARGWMLATALGYLAAAALAGAAVAYASLTLFFAVATFAMFALMALPGWAMLRQAGARA